MSARLHQPKPGWGPRLVLAGLVTILVFGACGTANLLREDAARQPLVLRHHVRRSTMLFVPIAYDTVSTDFLYRGQVLVPTAPECPFPTPNGADTKTRRQEIKGAHPLAGPEPRWVFELTCPDGQATSLYLLRLPPGGPEFHRIGAWHGWRRDNRQMLAPLTTSLSYLADTDSSGALFNWQTFASTPVRLPNLPAVRWQSTNANLGYSLAPDQHSLARVYREIRPGTGTAFGVSPVQPTPPLVRLLIDSYDLNQRSTRRLVLDSLRLQPVPIELMRLVEWTQTGGRWELLPRP